MKSSGIKVKIFNSEYNLVGENPSEVEKIANYVDSTMNKISFQSPYTSVESIAIVSALNIAENYFKEKESKRALEKEFITLLNEFTARIDDLNRQLENIL